MPKINDVLPRRSDLSTFVVHLTSGDDASLNLKSIVSQRLIEARNSYGQETSLLKEANIKCACFTETPLEHLYMLTSDMMILKRNINLMGLQLQKS